MDNSRLEQKLDLRRHFLRKYHAAKEERLVFDAFQGSEAIWNSLRKEFELQSYWGVDLKEKKGRIKIDSARILAQPGWRENIIDLDAYGSPWSHWQNALKNSDHSLTVFLTLGSRKGIQRRPLTKAEKQVLGITFDVPGTIGASLNEISLSWMLAQACARFRVGECLEAFPSTTARYFGIRLELTARRP